jgi:hypothetical protein
MATIIELKKRRQLIKLDAGLEDNEQEYRAIYALPVTLPFFENDIKTLKSQWNVEVSPLQQLDALLEVFCSGETLTFGSHFKPLNHLNDGIWELKTPDLRLFGWFPYKDCFILGAIDTAFKVKSYNLYAGHANVVAHFRGQLELDEPKFVTGEDPVDVVSNYNFP